MRLGTVLLAVALILALNAGAGAMDIARGGKAQVAIVAAGDDLPSVQHAAGELAMFLGKVSGGKFEVVRSAVAGKGNIYVGPKAAKMVDPAFSLEGLGDEGIVIRTVGDNLILAGGEPRGTLYAVYTFLEDYVGCRWWTPTASFVPKNKNVQFGDINLRYVPKLEYRDTDYAEATEADFSVRNKYNGHDHKLFIDNGFHNVQQDARRGGRKYAYARSDKWQAHAMWTLVPPEIYFNDHPEWFSLINGKRSVEMYHSGHCLTNEGLRKEMTQNARLALWWHPWGTMLSLEQPDDGGPPDRCECDNCKAVENEEGSPSGLMLRFVNSVAEDLEKQFPDTLFTTFAYHYTQKPPKITKPRGNVVVRLCDISCSFAKPLSDPVNNTFGNDLRGWGALTDRLYIWDYVSNFGYPLAPHPNLKVLGPNIKFLVDNGTRGYFAEAIPLPGSEMAELRSWVLAKLMWNPELDGWKLAEEFCRGYYGPAGEDVWAYLNLMQSSLEQSDDYLSIGSPVDAKFLSFDNLSKGWAMLQQAQRKADRDAQLKNRVRAEQMPLLYVFLMRWDELNKACADQGGKWPLSSDFQAVYKDFRSIAAAEGADISLVSQTAKMVEASKKP